MIEKEKHLWSFKSLEYHVLIVFPKQCFFSFSIHEFIFIKLRWNSVGGIQCGHQMSFECKCSFADIRGACQVWSEVRLRIEILNMKREKFNQFFWYGMCDYFSP